MWSCALLLLVGTLPTPDELLEKVRTQSKKIETWECEFTVRQEWHHTAEELKRARSTRPLDEVILLRGIHRFAAPDRYYFEWFPCNEQGEPLSAERFFQTGTETDHSRLEREKNGRQKTMKLPHGAGSPGGEANSFMPYFLGLPPAVTPKGTFTVIEKEGNLVLKGSQTRPRCVETYEIAIAPNKDFLICQYDYDFIYDGYPHPLSTTYNLGQLPSGPWVCTGGIRKQVDPDGRLRRKLACEIPLASIRVNQPFAAGAFTLPIANGTEVIDLQTFKSYTIGGRPDDSANRERLKQQLEKEGRETPTLATEAPRPAGMKARRSWWQTYQTRVGLVSSGMLLFLIAAVVRWRRSTD